MNSGCGGGGGTTLYGGGGGITLYMHLLVYWSALFDVLHDKSSHWGSTNLRSQDVI